jgi:hypothetical protein
MSWILAILGRFTSNRRWILSTLGVVLVALGAFALWDFGWRNSPDGRGVVTQWNDTIANLGIEPVFPPEEDIYVGDLFAVISADKRPGKGPRDQPLLNRAVKIEHIDMLAELIETYNELPIFPDTDKPPKAIQDPWLQKANPNGVFAMHGPRGLLTIAAFPGFTIRHERVASGGLTGLGFGLFGGSQQDSDTVELKIPFAETYGVPSALAVGEGQRAQTLAGGGKDGVRDRRRECRHARLADAGWSLGGGDDVHLDVILFRSAAPRA